MVRKILFLAVFMFLLVSCSGRQEVLVPEPQPVPEPTPAARPEPVVEPIPPPAQIPDVDVKEPVSKPVSPPEPKVPDNSCTILKKTGTLYTPADVRSGKISFDDYNDLRKCYPYFDPADANTQAVCCII